MLDKYGAKVQIDGTPKFGCAGGLLNLKTDLSMQKDHSEATYAGFADLVEVYDTADHKMLIKVLEHGGTVRGH